MILQLVADPLPLKLDSDGTVRVGGTRVTLDTLVDFYEQGQSPETIVRGFPTVDLSTIYTVIAYYLRHRAEVEAYLAEQERDAEATRRQIEANQDREGFRARLLARRAERAQAE